MKLKSNQPKASAEQVVKDIRRATRRHYSTAATGDHAWLRALTWVLIVLWISLKWLIPPSTAGMRGTRRVVRRA